MPRGIYPGNQKRTKKLHPMIETEPTKNETAAFGPGSSKELQIQKLKQEVTDLKIELLNLYRQTNEGRR